MKFFLQAFNPTANRRFNELVGFLLFVSAIRTLLCVASYSPLDPSLNTASPAIGSNARNWVGVVGAIQSEEGRQPKERNIKRINSRQPSQ